MALFQNLFFTVLPFRRTLFAGTASTNFCRASPPKMDFRLVLFPQKSPPALQNRLPHFASTYFGIEPNSSIKIMSRLKRQPLESLRYLPTCAIYLYRKRSDRYKHARSLFPALVAAKRARMHLCSKIRKYKILALK